MTDTPTAIVVDCSPDPQATIALELLQESMQLAKSGNRDGAAAKIAEAQTAIENSSATPAITIRPLTADEIAVRADDAVAATAHALDLLRAECDAVLANTDWTQLSDASNRLPAGTTADDWQTYRAAVFDRKAALSDPTNVPPWPTPPAVIDGVPDPS